MTYLQSDFFFFFAVFVAVLAVSLFHWTQNMAVLPVDFSMCCANSHNSDHQSFCFKHLLCSNFLTLFIVFGPTLHVLFHFLLSLATGLLPVFLPNA